MVSLCLLAADPSTRVPPSGRSRPVRASTRETRLAGSARAGHHRGMTFGALLVARLHIDLVRVSSAVCPASR